MKLSEFSMEPRAGFYGGMMLGLGIAIVFGEAPLLLWIGGVITGAAFGRYGLLIDRAEPPAT